MPVHVVEKLNKIVRSERKLRAELGREPTSAEIALELDLTIEEVEQIRRSAQAPVSLEKPVGDEEESEFGHFLTDDTAPLPDEVAEIELRKATLLRILETLSHRERRVLELRYGLERRAPADARRGRPDVQRHARADPADREPEPEEAARARRLADAQGRRGLADRPGPGGRT